MSEQQKPDANESTLGTWAKAAATSVVGLVAGAFFMYLTPLVNSAIKPPKPVSNFAAQAAGLTVEFSNRSTGGVQGWWDFGDGTALEPFDPKVETVKHTYPKSGTYNVKLTLANLLGEESDRTAPVSVDVGAAGPLATAPAIEQFELKPLDKRELAPAIYEFTTKASNAGFCILSCGDNKPMEIIDAGAVQKRYISFEEMGSYTIRLAAVNGKQLVEQTKTVYVGASDNSAPMARLLVSYQAIRVDRLDKVARIYCGWQGDTKATTSPFRKEWLAEPGFSILSAALVNKDDKNSPVRNVKYEVVADKAKVTLSGELVRPTSILAKGTPPHWVAELKLAQERRSQPLTIDRGIVSMAVNLNSSVKIPMQPIEPGYEVVRKTVTLQLWDGPRKIWEGNAGGSNVPVRIANQACQMNAIPQADGVVVSIAPVGPVIQTGGFSLFPKKGN